MRKSNNNDNNRLLYDPNQRNEKRLGAFSMQENSDKEDIENIDEVNNEESSEEQQDLSGNRETNVIEESTNNGQGTVQVARNIVKKEANDPVKAAIKKKVAVALLTSPIFWIAFGVSLLVFFLLSFMFSIGDSSSRIYNTECDFNLTNVSIVECRAIVPTDEDVEQPPLNVVSMSLDDYVVNTAIRFTKGDEFITDEGIKALMIILKTNVLSIGNYNNGTKTVSISECVINSLYKSLDAATEEELEKYKEYYNEIRDYLYINSAYKGTVTNLSTVNYLRLDAGVINDITNSSGDYLSILNELYQKHSKSDEEEISSNIYDKYLYIGDSRTNQMKNNNIIPKEYTVYGGGYGYNWFVGNGSFKKEYTNALNGAEAKANEIMTDGNYNIIINLGINDLSFVTPQTYFEEYYRLASNVWNNHNIFVVAVGPVDEERTSLKNDSVNKFNAQLSSLISNAGLANLWFVDIDYDIKNYDAEGIHYGALDYKNIYNSIINNIKGSKSKSSGYALYNLADNCEFTYDDEDNNTNLSYDSTCGSIPFFVNSLSKTEFVSKLRDYYDISKNSYLKVFADNAEMIYDLSDANGVNAELIVIRAILEGFSPVSQGYKNYNNYWGTRCFNGQPLSTCASYDSFDSGVLGYINMLKGYGVDNVLDIYYKANSAYIGRYWFNPGNAGQGGCYYYPYIKEYLSEERSRVVANACSTDSFCINESCIPTVDEDQLAYSKYHIRNYVKYRKDIFGIDSNLCTTECRLFGQKNPMWGSIPLGNSTENIDSAGCAVTSIAMGIACSGTDINIPNFNPGEFVKVLNANYCFTSGGGIDWTCPGIQKAAPNVSLVINKTGIHDMSNSYKIDFINSYFADNKNIFVVLSHSKSTGGYHYLLYQKTNGDKFVVKDPGGVDGSIKEYNINTIDQIVIYSY